MTTVRVGGLPSGAAGWRAAVADVAAATVPASAPPGLVLAFTLPATRWVDLDTLVESSLAGLRDAGWYRRGHTGLDALVATRAPAAGRGGLVVTTTTAGTVTRRAAPGPQAVAVTATRVPRPVRVEKRAWRDAISAAWGERPPLPGDARDVWDVWADLALRTDGSLLGPLERLIDALEPVLGRDPRGCSWQEFFPADDRITWLRVRRRAEPPAVRLTLGPRG